MKNKLNLYFIPALFLLLFSSCKKDSIDESILSNNKIKPQALTISDVSNSNNPYDSMGINHNNALNEFDFNNINSQQIMTWRENKLNALSPLNNEDNLAITYVKNNYAQISTLSNNSFEYILNSGNFGTDLNLVEDLIERLDQVYLMPNLNSMIIEIKDIENEILLIFDVQNNPNLLAATLLGTTSILRHSLYYWHEYQEEHPMASDKWNEVGNADAKSFAGAAVSTLTGAAIPALAAFITNPFAVLGGWVISSAVGSLMQASSSWGWFD